jgi:hypothetical protein
MDDKANSAKFYEIAGMAYFDMRKGPVSVTVRVDEPVTTVRVLPESFGIQPVIKGNQVSFEVPSPMNLTVDINGDYVHSLHLFVNREDTDIPDPDDPDVIYFGPGSHRVSSLEVGDGKTVYVAGGAIVRGVIDPDEKFSISGYSGLKVYSGATFRLNGKNITFRGRGIIDQNEVTTHGRNPMSITGENIRLEGFIVRNSSSWTVSLREVNGGHIDNIKLIGHRANSDGVDICSSHHILVENCFLRTLDDLVVLKTTKGGGPMDDVTVRKCVLWDESAHSLSIGAEITQDIENVLFTDCDIIHDHGREWSMRIFQTDAGWIKNVRFEDIRIEESVQFISLWINHSYWSTDGERGHIKDITFKNIALKQAPSVKGIEFLGYDREHAIENVLLENVTVGGKKVTAADVVTNEFVSGLVIR